MAVSSISSPASAALAGVAAGGVAAHSVHIARVGTGTLVSVCAHALLGEVTSLARAAESPVGVDTDAVGIATR